MRPVVVTCCFVLLLSTLSIRPAEAQWNSDSLSNTAVCIAKFSQTNPEIVSDGLGGAFIVWQDIRSTYNWDIYAQHLSPQGKALWGASGIAICDEFYDQHTPIICADGLGGAFIAWTDNRNLGGSDVYAQHINADGERSYARNGIAVGQAIREQRDPVMVLTSPGRAIIAFEDDRAANSPARPDITLNILTQSGRQFSNSGYEAVVAGGAQRQPRLVADAKGGALLVWENLQSSPVSIQGSLIDSIGSLKWNGGGSSPGYQIYKGMTTSNHASNASLALSGDKFLIAWQVTNLSSNQGEDIFANRFSRNGEKEWHAASEVTGEWPSDQANPKIVVDDSNGFIVFFEDYAGDLAPRYLNRDIAAVKVKSNGIDRLPAFDDGFTYVVRQSRAQRFYQMVEADDRFYFAWDDARGSSTNTNDTAIYAQSVDRSLKRHFPTYGTGSSWAKPIAVRADAQQEHVAMAKREGGGVIIAWTDNRNGDQDIYAQVLFKDGTLPIELASFDLTAADEQVIVDWSTANERDNAGFEIERRALALTPANFEVIASYTDDASLRSLGNSVEQRRYSYLDRPVVGTYEYRIADIGLDGTRTTHSSKQINTSVAAGLKWSLITAYPNPATDKVMIGTVLAEGARIQLEVRNSLGQLVLTRSITQDHAGVSYIDLPVADLNNGSYVYQVTGSSNGSTRWISPLQRFQVVR